MLDYTTKPLYTIEFQGTTRVVRCTLETHMQTEATLMYANVFENGQHKSLGRITVMSVMPQELARNKAFTEFLIEWLKKTGVYAHKETVTKDVLYAVVPISELGPTPAWREREHQ